MRYLLRLLQIACATAVLAWAADLSGTYQALGGKDDDKLVLKMKGPDVTGVLKNRMGEFKIENGNVDGSDIFFNIYIDRGGDHFKMTYRGHAFGDEIQFKIEAGERMLDLIVRKAS